MSFTSPMPSREFLWDVFQRLYLILITYGKANKIDNIMSH